MNRCQPLVAASVIIALAACSPSDTSAPAPTVTVTATASATPEPATTSATPSATTTQASTTATTTRPSADAPSAAPKAVDPTAYIVADGQYAFASPSGNLLCGLGRQVGCMSPKTVANLPECDDPGVTNGPMVLLNRGGAQPMCTTQGVFVYPDTKTLPYGSTITAAGVTCSSQPDGVRCWYVDNPATGLFASREKFSTLR